MEKPVFTVCSKESLKDSFESLGLAIPDKQGIVTFSAMVEDEIIGYALIQSSEGNSFVMSYLYIEPIFRDCGIGSSFLRFIKDYVTANFPDWKLVARYSSEMDLDKVRNFFQTNNCSLEKYAISNYYFTYDTWAQKIIPFCSIDYSKKVTCIEFSDLTDKQIGDINQKSTAEVMSDHMNPLHEQYNPSTDVWLFMYSLNSDLIGWCYTSHNHRGLLHIHGVYIFEKYRKDYLGIYSWTATHQWYTSHNIKVKNITFEVEKTDKRLYKFYKTIYGDWLSKDVDYYVREI